MGYFCPNFIYSWCILYCLVCKVDFVIKEIRSRILTIQTTKGNMFHKSSGLYKRKKPN